MIKGSEVLTQMEVYDASNTQKGSLSMVPLFLIAHNVRYRNVSIEEIDLHVT